MTTTRPEQNTTPRQAQPEHIAGQPAQSTTSTLLRLNHDSQKATRVACISSFCLPTHIWSLLFAKRRKDIIRYTPNQPARTGLLARVAKHRKPELTTKQGNIDTRARPLSILASLSISKPPPPNTRGGQLQLHNKPTYTALHVPARASPTTAHTTACPSSPRHHIYAWLGQKQTRAH